MAKYADQTTEAEIGDIVKCVAQIGSMFKPLLSDCSYKVAQLYGDSVYLEYPNEHGFLCSRFELIKRTGAAPSPEPEQPKVNNEQSPKLVVWPEEKKQLAFENLEINELFVFADSNDSFVRQKIGDTSFVTIAFDPTNSPNGYHSTLSDRAVRRLLMVQRPQFTVI